MYKSRKFGLEFPTSRLLLKARPSHWGVAGRVGVGPIHRGLGNEKAFHVERMDVV